MPTLELLHTRIFDADMDALRQQCFPGNYPNGSSKDRFDDRSIHVIVRAARKIAAYGRLTGGPDAYFENLFGGSTTVPTGPEVVDFGRVAVDSEYRGHDLFELILLEGLMLAADLGFPVVVGAARPERRFLPFIHELGFEDLPEGIYHYPEGPTGTFLPVFLQTRNRRSAWSTRKSAAIARLRAQGRDILDHGCPFEPPAGEGRA